MKPDNAVKEGKDRSQSSSTRAIMSVRDNRNISKLMHKDYAGVSL